MIGRCIVSLYVWLFIATGVGYSASQQSPLENKKDVKIVSKSWIGAGFFAELRKVVFNLIYRCEHKIPKTLIVDWSQQFFPYKDDRFDNGWDLYFEPIHSDKVFAFKGSKRPPEPKHDDAHCIQRWVLYKDFLPYRKFIHERFNTYITIKPEIVDIVDAFYEKYMKDHYCIGVHVRFAAAHTTENPRSHSLKLPDYIQEAKDQWELHSDRSPRIFVATDSQYVIEEFRRHFNDEDIIFTNAFRAQYDEDPHLIYERRKYFLAHPEEFHMRKPGYFGGLMTLVDCLLLSRCELFIHSVSNVSEFTVWFNPDIESVFLPKGQESIPCQCEQLVSYCDGSLLP